MTMTPPPAPPEQPEQPGVPQPAPPGYGAPPPMYGTPAEQPAYGGPPPPAYGGPPPPAYGTPPPPVYGGPPPPAYGTPPPKPPHKLSGALIGAIIAAIVLVAGGTTAALVLTGGPKHSAGPAAPAVGPAPLPGPQSTAPAPQDSSSAPAPQDSSSAPAPQDSSSAPAPQDSSSAPAPQPQGAGGGTAIAGGVSITPASGWTIKANKDGHAGLSDANGDAFLDVFVQKASSTDLGSELQAQVQGFMQVNNYTNVQLGTVGSGADSGPNFTEEAGVAFQGELSGQQGTVQVSGFIDLRLNPSTGVEALSAYAAGSPQIYHTHVHEVLQMFGSLG